MWRRSTEVSLSKKREVGVAARFGVVGAADPRQQFRQRVDRDAACPLQRRLRDQHRQRRLAGAGVTEEPQAAALGEPPVEIVDVGAHRRRPPLWSAGRAPCRRPAGGRRRRRGSAPGSPRRCRGCARGGGVRSRQSQGRATSSGPRIQPEPSQIPSVQTWSLNGSERAIAGIRRPIRTRAPSRRPRRTAAAVRRPAGRPARPGRCSRRTSGSGRGRPALWSRSGRSYAWR